MLMFGQNWMFDDFENIQTLVMFFVVLDYVNGTRFMLRSRAFEWDSRDLWSHCLCGRLNQPARVVVASDRLHQPQILCITSHPPPSLRLNQPIVPGDQWPASKFAVILIDLCPPAEPAAGKSTGRNNPPAEPAHRLNQPTACISRFVSSIARRLHRSRILAVLAQTRCIEVDWMATLPFVLFAMSVLQPLWEPAAPVIKKARGIHSHAKSARGAPVGGSV